MIKQKKIDVQSPQLVFVSMTNSMGGAENILQMLARSESSPVIFLKQTFSSILPDCSDRATYLTQGSLLVGFVRLLKEIRKYRKNYILFSTHPYLNAYLGFLKRIGYIESAVIVRECSSVFTRYSGLKRLSYKIAYRLGYPSVNIVICQTDLMRSQLLHFNSFISCRKVIVRENPLDLENVRSRAAVHLKDQDADNNYICSAGRLIAIKGFDILIKSFSKITLQNKDLKLLILGDGIEKENLIRLIKDMDLEGRVILRGHVDNPIPFFKNARLCVVSSIQEGFPNVLLEMMAVNSSVVSTLCAGGIENISSIIKAEANNVDALSCAIQRALTPDHKSQPEISSDYLKKRTPGDFLKSVLNQV